MQLQGNAAGRYLSTAPSSFFRDIDADIERERPTHSTRQYALFTLVVVACVLTQLVYKRPQCRTYPRRRQSKVLRAATYVIQKPRKVDVRRSDEKALHRTCRIHLQRH